MKFGSVEVNKMFEIEIFKAGFFLGYMFLWFILGLFVVDIVVGAVYFTGRRKRNHAKACDVVRKMFKKFCCQVVHNNVEF
jgi:hypothetical protein